MDYGSAKNSLQEIKNDLICRPLKTTGVLLIIFFAFIGGVVATSYVSGKISNYLNPPQSPVDIYKPPSLELTYTRQGQKKDEGTGLYNTVFLLRIHRPPGNFDLGFRIIQKYLEAECSKPNEMGTTEMTSGGIASTTSEYKVTCISKQPIIDTGNLFILTK